MADQWEGFEELSSPQEKKDEWAGFEEVGGSMEDIKTVMGKSALSGAVETGTIMGTTALGAKVPGPLPVRALGAAAGFGAGVYLAGKEREWMAERGLAYESMEDVPPELRPYAVAGETFGGGVALTGGVVALAKMGYQSAGTTFVGRYLNDVMRTAKSSPLLFSGTELMTTTSSAAAGGLAEQVAPGDMLARFGAETVGGFFNLTRMGVWATRKSRDIVQGLWQKLSPEGRKTAAANIVGAILETYSEDPVVIKQLLDVYNEGVTTNVAQITGSPGLADLSASLTKVSGQYGKEAEDLAKNAFETVYGMLEVARRTAYADGGPEALQKLAELEKAAFEMSLEASMKEAEQAAVLAASRITQDTPAARMELSVIARNALNESIQKARTAERELWGQVPEAEAGIENIVARFNSISDELVPGEVSEALPNYLRNYLKSLGAKVDDTNAGTDSVEWPEEFKTLFAIEDGATEAATVTTKKLTVLRSSLLKLQTGAIERGDYNQARVYGELASATLDDLDAAFTGDPAYSTARAFSRSFNETFTKNFTGRATAQGRFGDQIQPELLLTVATAANPEATALNMLQLENATRFLVKEGISDDPTQINAMLDAQERFIRLAAADAVNESGTVDVKKLTKFMESNEAMLKRFPEVRKVLDDAINTDLGRQAIEHMNKGQLSAFESQSAFSQILKSNPIKIVQAAITDGNIEKGIMPMIDVAKNAKNPAVAMEAVKISAIDAAMQSVTGRYPHQAFNFDDFERIMFKPSKTGGKSLARVLQENGVLTTKDTKNLKEIITLAQRVKTGVKGTALDVEEDGTELLMTSVIRAIGATVATKASQMFGTKVSGHTLIIAGTGAKAMDRMINSIPSAQVKNILIEAMRRPDLMKLLLDKAPEPEKQMANFRQVHAYLIQAGIINPATEE